MHVVTPGPRGPAGTKLPFTHEIADPIAAGGTITQIVAVAGLLSSDVLIAVARAAAPTWPSGVLISGAVSGAGFLALDFTNTTASPITVGAQSYTAIVHRT